MQAVKDKINEMGAMRKVKAEARAEEKAEKDIAKARTDVAHEVRLAKEAEASMSHHVARAGEIAKAGEKVVHERQMAKHGVDTTSHTSLAGLTDSIENMPAGAGPGSHPNYNQMS